MTKVLILSDFKSEMRAYEHRTRKIGRMKTIREKEGGRGGGGGREGGGGRGVVRGARE